LRMATAWSMLILAHASSHGLKQTLPQMAGKGMSFLMMSTASVNFPLCMSETYACTFTCAGHSARHGGSSFFTFMWLLVSIVEPALRR
jgi:hypothetical protein